MVQQLQASAFAAALRHYREFVAFVVGREDIQLLPTVTHLIAHGDTAVHTFMTVGVGEYRENSED